MFFWLNYTITTITVRGLTRGRMLITECCTARLQSDQSDIYIYILLGNQATPISANQSVSLGTA